MRAVIHGGEFVRTKRCSFRGNCAEEEIAASPEKAGAHGRALLLGEELGQLVRSCPRCVLSHPLALVCIVDKQPLHGHTSTKWGERGVKTAGLLKERFVRQTVGVSTSHFK